MHEKPEDFAKLVAQIHKHTVHAPVARADGGPDAAPLSVQEWTGQGWAIVEVLGEPGLVEPSPLDASSFPGQYVGQRVVSA
jgi:hypothetical protein